MTEPYNMTWHQAALTLGMGMQNSFRRRNAFIMFLSNLIELWALYNGNLMDTTILLKFSTSDITVSQCYKNNLTTACKNLDRKCTVMQLLFLVSFSCEIGVDVLIANRGTHPIAYQAAVPCAASRWFLNTSARPVDKMWAHRTECTARTVGEIIQY